MLSIINIHKGHNDVEETRKRFKINEQEEQIIDHNNSITTNPKPLSNVNSGSFLFEEEESEFLSSGEDNFGILKAETWLNQNDVLGEVSGSPVKKVVSSTKDLEGSFSSGNNQMDLSIEEPEMFILQRGEEEELVNNFLGETVGNIFSQASMLTLNIVMCLILWLSGSRSSEGKFDNRDFSANIPEGRIPMSADYFEIEYATFSYMRIGLFTVFVISIILLKWGGCLKSLSFDPRKNRKENTSNF